MKAKVGCEVLMCLIISVSLFPRQKALTYNKLQLQASPIIRPGGLGHPPRPMRGARARDAICALRSDRPMRRERRYLGSRESRAMAFFHGQDSHCAPAFSLFYHMHAWP